eukprot:s3094_g19.t1
MVGEEEYEEEWHETEDWYETNDGYWADDQTWHDGYWANEDLYYKDEYGYFQKKGKGKGKKGKNGKDDEGKGKPGDGKGKSNYAQPQTSSNPPVQQQQQAHYSSAAPSSSAHGFLATVETEPARVDVLTATYEEEPFPKRRARRGGRNRRDAVAQQHRVEAAQLPVHIGENVARQPRSSALSRPVPREVGLQDGTSFFTYGHSEEPEKPSQFEGFEETKGSSEIKSASFYAEPSVQACENGIAFHNENNAPPTVCILDLGCTRAMDKRQYLHEMTRSPAPPIPKDQLLDDRDTHIEYQDGKKVLHKDNWKAEKKRFSDNLDGYWKGKTVYKIKDGYGIPDGVVKTDIERNAKRLGGSIDDVFQPQQSSPSQPSGVQKKPSSSQKEVGKSSGPRFKKVEIEVGPPAAKRHVGKQKPVVVVPVEGSSSKKKVVVSYPEQPDELDRIAKEMGSKIQKVRFRNWVVMLLSLGGYLFHYPVVKCKP